MLTQFEANMRIQHLVRTNLSRFYPIVVAALGVARTSFPARPVTCELGEPKAYPGDVHVTIATGADFDTDWEGRDETRFPQRIRAAATALRDTGHHGRFHITHRDGSLTISE